MRDQARRIAQSFRMPSADLEGRLRDRLATHVTIHHGEKKGRIEIQYYGNDDLDRILSLLGVSA